MASLAGVALRPTAVSDSGDPGVWGSNEGEDMVEGRGVAGVAEILPKSTRRMGSGVLGINR